MLARILGPEQTSGFKVQRITFDNGVATGTEDFLSGFLKPGFLFFKRKARFGRPAGVIASPAKASGIRINQFFLGADGDQGHNTWRRPLYLSSTATMQQTAVWIMNAKFNELVDCNNVPSKTFTLQKAVFKPIPKPLRNQG